MHPTHRGTRALSIALLAMAIVALVGRRADAEITAEARPVVDRYVEAIGGRAACDAVQTSHSEGSLQSHGNKISFSSYNSRPDRQSLEYRLGKAKSGWGFDGQAGWSMDWQGKVSPKEGKDLDDAKASAYFANQNWLMADQGGGHITVSSSETDPTGACVVLEVTPPVGSPVTMWFNNKTGLIDRETSKNAGDTIIDVLSDYRRVGGVLSPFRLLETVPGKPDRTLSLEITSADVNKPIDDARYRMPKESAEAAATPDWIARLGTGLYPGIKVWKGTKTSLSMNRIDDPGTILVVQKEGISGTKAGEGFALNVVADGVISQKGSASNVLFHGGTNRRDFKAGDKFYLMAFNIKEEQIAFDLLSCGTFDVTTKGTTKAERYTTQVRFDFPAGYLAAASPADVRKAMDAVLIPEEMIKSAAPATVELGQSFEQVEQALGKPMRIVNLGAKVMWIYSDMKVVFMDGKVSDVQ